MTVNDALERELGKWFDAEATSTPDDLLARSVAHIERTAQRPGILVLDRYPGRRLPVGVPLFVPAALVLVAVLLATMGLVGGGGRVVTPQPAATTTDGDWNPQTELAFRAQFDEADNVPVLKWRAGTYAQYTLSGWEWGDGDRERVAAGEPMSFLGEGDAATSSGRRRIEIAISPIGFDAPTVLGPNLIESVDRPVDAITVSDGGWFTSIEAAEGGGPYTVTALIRVEPGEVGGLTEAGLRAAGTTYSPAVLGTYLQLPDGAMGPISTKLLESIRAAVPAGQDPGNPYDLARAMERYLGGVANFTYDDDVRDEVAPRCTDVSTVECFAIIKRGYCEYFASTMTVLLRASGVPARVAYGFLPNARGLDGVEEVGGWLAHWWVEVFFPGVGWVEFDPTGGAVGQPQLLPPGP